MERNWEFRKYIIIFIVIEKAWQLSQEKHVGGIAEIISTRLNQKVE